MPGTRAALEAELIDYCGLRLARVHKDGTTVNGTNASLNFPITAALRDMGQPASGVLVTDADIAAVPEGQAQQLVDYAKLYTLRAILNNCDEVDEIAGAGQDNQRNGQFAVQVRDAIEILEAWIEKRYGAAPIPTTVPDGVTAAPPGGIAIGSMTRSRTTDANCLMPLRLRTSRGCLLP